jgi:hypothetical protein
MVSPAALRSAFLFIRLVCSFMVWMSGWLVLWDEAPRTRTDIGHAKACSRNPRGSLAAASISLPGSRTGRFSAI